MGLGAREDALFCFYVCASFVYSYIYFSTSELSAVARNGANVRIDNFI